MKRAAVITAMASETNYMVREMTGAARVEGLIPYVKGTIGNCEVFIIESGIGKVNAAVHTQYIIHETAPELIINTGIAGGVGEGLTVGAVVVASGLVEHDFDLSPIGFAPANLETPGEQAPTVFKTSDSLSALLCETAEELVGEGRVRTGLIATGDQFISSAKQKLRLREGFGALAAEMEGGAVAHTARINHLPVVVMRAVSDLADGTAAASFEEFEEETAQLSACVVGAFIKKLG